VTNFSSHAFCFCDAHDGATSFHFLPPTRLEHPAAGLEPSLLASELSLHFMVAQRSEPVENYLGEVFSPLATSYILRKSISFIFKSKLRTGVLSLFMQEMGEISPPSPMDKCAKVSSTENQRPGSARQVIRNCAAYRPFPRTSCTMPLTTMGLSGLSRAGWGLTTM
jgi:hypothetical protein